MLLAVVLQITGAVVLVTAIGLAVGLAVDLRWGLVASLFAFGGFTFAAGWAIERGR